MRIEFENKISDIAIFNFTHLITSPLIQGITLLLAIDASRPALNASHMIRSIAIIAAIYIMMLIVQQLFVLAYTLSRKNKSFTTNNIIELQDDAILEITKHSTSHYNWAGILKIAARANQTVIYVTPQAALIIPNRTFSSADQKNKFIETVQSKITQHKFI